MKFSKFNIIHCIFNTLQHQDHSNLEDINMNYYKVIYDIIDYMFDNWLMMLSKFNKSNDILNIKYLKIHSQCSELISKYPILHKHSIV